MTAPKGEAFEALVIDRFYSKKGFKPSNTKQDKYEGTDFYWHGVPVDVTLNPSKNFVERVGSIDLACSTLRIGLRRRNAHDNFLNPVLVLYFESKVHSIIFIVNELTEELLEEAVSMYWDYQDETAEISG